MVVESGGPEVKASGKKGKPHKEGCTLWRYHCRNCGWNPQGWGYAVPWGSPDLSERAPEWRDPSRVTGRVMG
jgi:hypothetical protein